MRLKENLDSPKKTFDDVFLVDDLGWGMTAQKIRAFDNNFVEDVTNFLFQPKPMSGTNKTGGMDLVALNIQRGRDHRLLDYNQYREFSGQKKATQWNDFSSSIPIKSIEKLKNIYGQNHWDDVDQFVGGILERPQEDAQLGRPKAGPRPKAAAKRRSSI